MTRVIMMMMKRPSSGCSKKKFENLLVASRGLLQYGVWNVASKQACQLLMMAYR